jgi:SAM-dependent methyltransferase
MPGQAGGRRPLAAYPRLAGGCRWGTTRVTTRARPVSGLYEVIGRGYAGGRRTDPRIAARIWAALGGARAVVNVGAGTSSYEPPGRQVVAVEPSAVMRAQRPPGAAPCVAAVAERLPFADRCFDAAMSVLSDQHWADPLAGLAEMARVARRVVVLQFDTCDPGRFWLTRDYLPEFAQLTEGVPTLAERAAAIGARLEVVPVRWDCADGFFHAYWRRPHAYLRPDVRRATSVWARVGPAAERRAIRELRDDLLTGRWARRNAGITGLDEIDLGARLLIT